MEPIRKDMEFLSNSMATFAHINANPESFALFFMMGVCAGLLLALCLLVTGIACQTRRRPRTPPSSPERKQLKEEEEEEDGESLQEEDGGEGDSEIPTVTVATGERSLWSGTLTRSVDVFASAEELERARRLEERERIVREIWRNGQPDILATGTGTIGRVHYH